MTLEVAHWHEKLAPESGVEFMPTVSGACVRGLSLELESLLCRPICACFYLFSECGVVMRAVAGVRLSVCLFVTL